MKALLTRQKRMNKSLAFNETRRVENLTESEKNAKRQTDLAYKNTTLMTWDRHKWNALFKWIGEKPTSTDEQRIAKASEFGEAYKKQFGVMPI